MHTLLHPIHHGDLILLEGRVILAGKSSMVIEIQGFRQDMLSRTFIPVQSCHVIMVAINYRLTTLGFLALDDGVTKGNYGFADQINALEWILKNIQDFVGDPNRITIFGQSAGDGSVRGMLASPKSNGKFGSAI